MLILFLCRKSDFELVFASGGYMRAFERRGVRVAHVEDSFPCDGDINLLVDRCDEKPALIVYTENSPLLPRGLTEVSIPTACFNYDVYAYTYRRVRWAALFDYPFLFHPGFEEPFRAAGHPN